MKRCHLIYICLPVVFVAGWKTLSVDELVVLAEAALFLWHQAKNS